MEASISKENQLQLAVCGSTAPFQELLESQKGLLHSQIEQLQNIVVAQCKLTGVNPLSQEMAAGALSIKIGKRPRDLLNPKAVKYMQSVFSVKDAITKKESREISALFGVTVTQVREYFTTQRSRVRKFVRLSREKALRSCAPKEVQNGDPMSTDPIMPVYPVPLNSLGPASGEEAPGCSTQDETLTGLEDSDRHFLENIFNLMRKEETFSGQVKLMEWILQIQNSSVLYWFLTKGGVMILATWLSQAASEEQTSVLHVILKVLCHLPLHKTLPVHMSAILQSVNRLRFYRTSDISNRARILLSRWSKMFARSQAMKKPNSVKSSTDAQDEMLLKQSISEIMGDESWESKIDVPEDNPAPSFEGSENFRKLEPLQPPKLLPASADDSSKKLIRGVSSSQTRERRKVLLVEQPGQKSAGRSLQVARSATTSQGRPLSADDIQKAKLRAQFMQSKYGKSGASSGGGHQVKVEGLTKASSSQARNLPSASKAHVWPQVEECKESVSLPSEVPSHQEAPLSNKINLNPDEPIWKKCRRFKIPWWTPAEMRIQDVWRVGTGENSKEVEVQRNRIRREKETIYRTSQEIPSDPKEPWDREMEYDDTLTPEVPTQQLPDADGVEAVVSPCEETETSRQNEIAAPTVPSQNSDGGMPEPDLELLAVLLKNPELVFALTSGRSGSNLSSEETVKLLDMIKANGVGSLEGLAGLVRKAEENVQVSLPSPTPSDPVTSGWRPEFSKNPFSRQSAIANRDRIASSEVPAAKLVRPEPAPINVLPQQAASVPNFSHQTILHHSLPQTATVLPEKSPQPPPVVVFPHQHQSPATISPNLQIPPLEIVQSIKSVPLNGGSPLSQNLAAAALPSMQVQTLGYVEPALISITGNTPERPPQVAFPAAPSLPTPPPPLQRAQPHPHSHPHRTLISEFLPSRSLRVNHGLTSKPLAETNENNYNPFVGGAVRPGIPRDRNELLGEPEFESWSPENSPVRPTEYVSGWNAPEPRMNMGNSYRSEPDRWNSSGYRDYSRHGNRRRREWRR